MMRVMRNTVPDWIVSGCFRFQVLDDDDDDDDDDERRNTLEKLPTTHYFLLATPTECVCLFNHPFQTFLRL